MIGRKKFRHSTLMTLVAAPAQVRVAHRDEQVRIEFSVAIGGAADMDGRAAQPETGANAPELT